MSESQHTYSAATPPHDTPSSHGVIEGLTRVVLETFIVIGFGYASRAFAFLSEDSGRGIGELVGKILLPGLLFRQIALLDMGSIDFNILAAILLSRSLVFLLAVATALCGTGIWKDRMALGGLFGVIATQGNDIAFGYPIIQTLFPAEIYGVDYCVYCFLSAPIQLVLLNPIAMILLASAATTPNIPEGERGECPFSHKAEMVRAIAVSVLTNPQFFMVACGLFWNMAFGPRLPGVLDDVLQTIGSGFTAGALFLLGWTSYGCSQSLKGEGMLTPLLLAFFKLLVLPVLMQMLVALLAISHDRDVSKFAFIFGSIPTAPGVPLVLAQQFEVHPHLVAGSLILILAVSAPLLIVATVLFNDVSSKEVMSIILQYTTVVQSLSCAGSLLVLAAFAGYRVRCWRSFIQPLVVVAVSNAAVCTCLILQANLVYGHRSWTAEALNMARYFSEQVYRFAMVGVMVLSGGLVDVLPMLNPGLLRRRSLQVAVFAFPALVSIIVAFTTRLSGEQIGRSSIDDRAVSSAGTLVRRCVFSFPAHASEGGHRLVSRHCTCAALLLPCGQ
ncbi:hypothetical protein CYMTET_14451, partial [Cymbomonas tetramitiformis]